MKHAGPMNLQISGQSLIGYKRRYLPFINIIFTINLNNLMDLYS